MKSSFIKKKPHLIFIFCISLYAEDIVFISDCEEHMQEILDTVSQWCSKWRLSINMKELGVVHFRRKRTTLQFRVQIQVLLISSIPSGLQICRCNLTFNSTQKPYQQLVDLFWVWCFQKSVYIKIYGFQLLKKHYLIVSLQSWIIAVSSGAFITTNPLQ